MACLMGGCSFVLQCVYLCLFTCGLRLIQEEKVAVAKAKDFLESNTYSADDPYTTALSAYALALLRSPYAPLALRHLNHMAITQGTATLITVSHMSNKTLEELSTGQPMYEQVSSKNQMLNESGVEFGEAGPKCKVQEKKYIYINWQTKQTYCQ